MPKLSKFALGGLAVLAIWVLVVLRLLYQQEFSTNPLVDFLQWLTRDSVSFFTAVLALSTTLLWFATWRGIRGQSEDTRILQRAYLSVEPSGLHPMVGRPEGQHVVIGHVQFRNVGHLLARNVSWSIEIKLSADGDLNDFPIFEDHFLGPNVLFPGTTATRASGSITLGPRPEVFIYVWGQVRYDDGFGQRRFTSYCHRYNRAVLRKLDGGHGILERDARFHEYGNDAN
jgi:hypothetical protein